MSKIKYLVKNYATSKDIMLYMIKNKKHNHIVRINKNIFDTKQNKLFFIGPINLDIQINDNIFMRQKNILQLLLLCLLFYKYEF